MLLAIDIGNSDITIGVYQENTWKYIWRIPSRPDQPELFYGVRVRDYFLEARLSTDDVRHLVLSSVVPSLTPKFKNVLHALFNQEVLTLGPSVYEHLPLEILNPFEIGSDLVANAVAAFYKYKQTCVVVDFGTALTFTTVSGSGKILGVSIAPGVKTAIRSLSQNTAKLFDVPLELPASALGRNTVSAIQTGILIGYDGMVRSVVGAIRTEVGENCLAIGTGGLSSTITSLRDFFHAIEPTLTLDGLRFIAETIRPSR